VAPLAGSAWGQRAFAAALALIGIPIILSISAFWQQAPITEGQASPRTVLAPEPIRVDDPEATDRERRNQAAAVEPILVADVEARAAIIQDVEDTFARVRQAREPSSGEDEALGADEQVESLVDSLDWLSRAAIRDLVELSDDELALTESHALQTARELATRTIGEDEVEDAKGQIDGLLAVLSFPDDVGTTAVKPILEQSLRPTVREDEAATQTAREQASAAVAPLQKTFAPGTPIVQVGEQVSAVQMAALRSRSLQGADPRFVVVRSLALTIVVTAALVFYVRAYRRTVWDTPRLLVLLAVLAILFVLSLQAVVMFAADTGPLVFLLPAGAFAMLTTILFDPPVGVLVTIPITAFTAYMVPSRPGLAAFAALSCLVSVPLVSRLSARGALRTAAWRSTLAYGVLAAVLTAVFTEAEEVPVAALAGLGSGILSAVIVNATLPFLESVFGVLTATSLLDLADRNHPLLRELEQKALGSYNHSVEVSKMVERAARAISADSLLASVAALYHDIGKVQRPYFFVENQFGIDNPHDNLEPDVSARIIKEHVTDGIEIARSYRMPAEIVDGIRTHHGTTVVGYFFRKAVNAAPDPDAVDEARFRYEGRKPSTREMAILMLADCCEGATRAAALADRNLTRDVIADIVTGLIDDRVEDGQLDDANITFRELRTVRESFIESLCYVYHPRITYPELRPRGTTVGRQNAPDSGERTTAPTVPGSVNGAGAGADPGAGAGAPASSRQRS
jgi:putative nucleotidyltransferase with HDIG domain